jgi:hypothetical protein
MNQILSPSSILSFEPTSTPALLPHLIAKTVIGHTIEAVRCSVTDDDSDYVKAYYADRWLVVERDPLNNIVRESTGSFASPKAAFNAFWYATADDPLDFEDWITPIWATFAQVA